VTAVLTQSAPTRTPVLDCPTYAWDESDQAARVDLGAFYSLYRADLDADAHELIRGHLIALWRRKGVLVRVVDLKAYVAAEGRPGEPDDEQRWAVWQEAADQITAEELVFAAGLVDEYAAWGDR
jgi:hypothetical protein